MELITESQPDVTSFDYGGRTGISWQADVCAGHSVIVFFGTDANGNYSAYVAQVSDTGNAPPSLLSVRKLLSVGDVIDGRTITWLDSYDPISTSGNIVLSADFGDEMGLIRFMAEE